MNNDYINKNDLKNIIYDKSYLIKRGQDFTNGLTLKDIINIIDQLQMFCAEDLSEDDLK